MIDSAKPTGYSSLKNRKSTGAHYTPTNLSDFVAKQIAIHVPKLERDVVIGDPAIGDGELLFSLTDALLKNGSHISKAVGFDIDKAALQASRNKLLPFQGIELDLRHTDFTEFAVSESSNGLFTEKTGLVFDAVIANPPYVRTQVLGSDKSQLLAKQFGLNGRVDLYHAFILGIANVLREGGILGIIVSNRFITTKSGENLRENISDIFDILHIWDFGDTQLFEAAVLPAVLLLRKKTLEFDAVIPGFSSIYTEKNSTERIAEANNVFDAIKMSGLVKINGKNIYNVQHGSLDVGKSKKSVWRISNSNIDDWLKKVEEKTFLSFSDLGKIKVGVKTTADKVFIKSDWKSSEEFQPELLKKLTTHHVARRFKALDNNKWKWILYPHESVNGIRRVVDIEKYPISEKYLTKHKEVLSSRTYVIEAGRKWYEIWVPHDPLLWEQPKIIFRDISEKPTFWLDTDGTVVNGDCYWFVVDKNNPNLSWLALAVSNSSFIENFYDRKFNNKLYSGRRRFITQYVEQFPLPDPSTDLSKKIVEMAKTIYDRTGKQNTSTLENELDSLIWDSFGVSRPN